MRAADSSDQQDDDCKSYTNNKGIACRQDA